MLKSDKIKILSRKILHNGWSNLSSYSVFYKRENGQQEIQRREIFNSGDGAAILLYNPTEKKIVLIRQFRLPVYLNHSSEGFILECCAGLLDQNDPITTIKKEVYEETGYLIDDVKKVYEAFASPGVHMEKIHFFVGMYDNTMKKSSGGGHESEQEEIEILEFRYEDIKSLIGEGKIIDSKTIVLLQWALIHLIH